MVYKAMWGLLKWIQAILHPEKRVLPRKILGHDSASCSRRGSMIGEMILTSFRELPKPSRISS